jgi:sugar phosphate isomerase/epimerase
MLSTRRTFLAQSIAAGMLLQRRVFGAETTTPVAGPKRKMTMDLYCDFIGVKADQRQAIELAHKHGFESVVPDGPFLVKLSDSDLSAMVDDLKQKNLVWGAAGIPFRYRIDDGPFAEAMKTWPDIAKALHKAGATRVSTWITPSDDKLTYLQNFKRTVSRFREIAKPLKDNGLRLGLEYVGPKLGWTKLKHGFIHTMVEDKELIAEIAMDNVGMVIDSWHWYCAGETLDDILTLKGEDIIAVDLNDAPANIKREDQVDSRRELPATTGVIDVAGFLNALNKIGFDGPVRAEPFSASLKAMSPDLAVAATAEAMKRAFAMIK